MSVGAVGSRAALRVQRRIAFTRWVRKTHGWFGLWGALLGLIFGLSGVWLNHRAVMKLELPAQKTINGQVALPADTKFDTPDAMAIWLASALNVQGPLNVQRVEKSRPVAWSEGGGQQRRGGERGNAERGGQERAAAERGGADSGGEQRSAPPLMQPERWMFNFGNPSRLLLVEYWAGNKSISVRTVENGFIATLTNLHKGVGMPIPWILLVDTLAGSLIFLSISGLILWWETNRRRGLGIAIFGVSIAATVGLALWPILS